MITLPVSTWVPHATTVIWDYVIPTENERSKKGHGTGKKAKLDEDDRTKYTDEEWLEQEYEDNYFLAIVFHNLKAYDAHFVIKHFKKQYTECD